MASAREDSRIKCVWRTVVFSGKLQEFRSYRILKNGDPGSDLRPVFSARY
jgi:hypothetical protein